MGEFKQMHIDLRQMIIALETMVDLVGMNDTHHAKRVGYIAGQIAHALQWDDEKTQFVFELGLLHDCGVSTEQMHSELVNHFDWEDAHIHCEVGYRLLKHFAPLSRFAEPILYHHTPYETLQSLDLSQEVVELANLIFLADRIDVMGATHYGKDILLARREIVATIQSYRGTYFDPSLVDAFLQVEQSEAFWISLEDRHIIRYAWDMGQVPNSKIITVSQLKQMSLIMAYIVDQKSPFTAQHSARVGSLARYIAKQQGLSHELCEKVEIAGFIHDIGKLRMPDNILEKPGPLSDIERSIMNQHSYETYEILRRIEGIEDIAMWAAYHHENIEGTGYPFHPPKKEISIEARIIAVADVFQALAQDRPYRQGMDLEQIMSYLDSFVALGKLDGALVNIVKMDAQNCFEIAWGRAKENKESEIPFFSPRYFEEHSKET